jgi:hypothetical protein
VVDRHSAGYDGETMDQPVLLALMAAGVIGLCAAVLALTRERTARAQLPVDSPFAASTEGEKVCPKCGMGNLWTDASCISCGGRLA